MGATGRPRPDYRGQEPEANGAGELSSGAGVDVLGERVAEDVADDLEGGRDLETGSRDAGVGDVSSVIQMAGIRAGESKVSDRRRRLEAERLAPEAIVQRCGNPPGPLPLGTTLADWYVVWSSTMDAYFVDALGLARNRVRGVLPADDAVSIAGEVIHRIAYRMLGGETYESPKAFILASTRNEVSSQVEAELRHRRPEKSKHGREGKPMPTRVYAGDDGVSPPEGIAEQGTPSIERIVERLASGAFVERVLAHPACTKLRKAAIGVVLAKYRLGAPTIPPAAWLAQGIAPHNGSQLVGDTLKWIERTFPDGRNLL